MARARAGATTRATTARLRVAMAFAAAPVATLATSQAQAAPDSVPPAAPTETRPLHLDGDVGIAALAVQGSAPGQSVRTRAIPYVYADFGPLFAREDTVGFKLLPVGWGSLELAARVSTEGEDGAGPGVASRRNPRPVGLGTFQETPWGGVFADAFVDAVSGGTLLEASYAAELYLGPVSFYPQAGVARRSARYVDHLFGVGAAEAQATGLHAYAPGASTTPVLGLSAEWMVTPRWALVAHAERERYDGAIADSPRVNRHGATTAFIAVARHFD